MRIPKLATAVAGGCLLLVAASVPALAAPLAGMAKYLSLQTQSSGNSLVQKVQRRRRRGVRRGRGDAGAAAAGAIIGLGIGAIIASEAARRNQAIEYCMQRYRSYDPYSMTYMGYDGRRHPCP
jgi:hypothetical protein